MTTSIAEAAGEVRRQGGLFVVNHPRSAGYPWCTGCRWEYGDETPGYADAVEVLNGAWPRHQNEAGLALWDRWLNAGHRIPATAGTDSHGFARQPELLGFTYVRAGRSAAEILEAIKAGRSYLSRGPSIVWLEDDGGLGVRVTGVTGQLEAGLVADGHRRKREPVAEDGEVRFERPSARWYRAELYERGAKVAVALTNPAWPTADETNQGRRETTRAGRPE